MAAISRFQKTDMVSFAVSIAREALTVFRGVYPVSKVFSKVNGLSLHSQAELKKRQSENHPASLESC
jgi:hypothetical protein